MVKTMHPMKNRPASEMEPILAS